VRPLAGSLVGRLRDALAAPAPPSLHRSGDYGALDAWGPERVTPAAVLVAVTDRAEPGVILTQRTETLRRHAGQVAFPGGRLDPGEDAVAAALREAEEEVALPAGAVELAGVCEPYRTGTGFEVTPVVGVVPPDLTLVPAEAEVAAVFEVPLAFLLDPANRQERFAEWHGATRPYYEVQWRDRRIWGATAGMIANLAHRLEGRLA